MITHSKITPHAEALLRMVAPGAGFRGVTLYDVTPLMKIISKSRRRPKNGLHRKLSAFSVQINDGDQIK